MGTAKNAQAERSELDLASAGIRSRQGRYRECTRFAQEAAVEATRAGHRSGSPTRSISSST